jgi:hypothetical protein
MNPENNYERCLNAARASQRDPTAVRKCDFPSRKDFDDALDELADVLWDCEAEPCWKAYARAMDSPDGQLLYAAREQARPVVKPVCQPEPVPVTKAEQKIFTRIAKYQKSHPGVTPEKALIKVLEANPGLYTAYLSQCT